MFLRKHNGWLALTATSAQGSPSLKVSEESQFLRAKHGGE